MNPIELLKLEAEQIDSVSDFLKRYPNVIVDPGVNWCHLHQVTEEQLKVLKDLFNRKHIRYSVYTKSFGIEDNLCGILRMRKWFSDEKLYPGVKEKAIIIAKIEEYQKTGEFSGINKSAYPELLQKLRSIPDIPDVEGYCLRYCY